MKIIQVNSLLSGGGTDDQCLKLSAGLKELGCRVVIAGPAKAELSPRLFSQRLPLHVLPRQKFGFVRGLHRLIKIIRPQIVHAHHGRDYWPTVLACRLSGVPCQLVLSRHLAKSPSSWLSKNFLLGQCNAMVAVSDFVAKVLISGVIETDSPVIERRSRPPMRGDHRKIRVIHGGIDLENFRPFDASALRAEWGLQPHHFAFAVVGAYDLPVGKGQMEFLEAAARIHQLLPQARFLIIGRGTMREALLEKIQALGLQEKAFLIPYCHQMPSAMNAIDCLVHPAQGTEAFGLVLIEAFACGKPVIATRLDGVPEAFNLVAHGQLVDSLAPSALAEAMIAVAAQKPVPANEPDHRSLLQKFSLQSMAQQYLTLYRELLQSED